MVTSKHDERPRFVPFPPAASSSAPMLPSSLGSPFEEQVQFCRDGTPERGEGGRPIRTTRLLARGDPYKSFSDFGVAGRRRFPPSPNGSLPPPSPSFLPPSRSSIFPLSSIPSPLILQSIDPTPFIEDLWDSRDPFLKPNSSSFAAGFESTQGFLNATTATGGMLIRSADETRTSKACQACRARKSKCDGKPSCIRCEKKGQRCVYVDTQAARTRANRPSPFARSSSSSVSALPPSASNSITHPHPLFIASDLASDPNGGDRTSSRNSFAGEFGQDIRGWRKEVGSLTSRGEGRCETNPGFSRTGSSSYEVDEEERRRRRPLSTDPSHPSSLLVPSIGRSHFTPLSYRRSQLGQTFYLYPNPSPTQFYHPPPPPPPPPPQQQQRQPAFVESQPRPSPLAYPPSFHSSNNHYNAPLCTCCLHPTSAPHAARSFEDTPPPTMYEPSDASSSPSFRNYDNDTPQSNHALHPTEQDPTRTFWEPSCPLRRGMSPQREEWTSPSSSTLGGGRGLVWEENKWASMSYSG